MKKLLMKEFRLSMHPSTPLMLLLSAMVFIPNYPFVVIFFYTTMSVFFTCLSGRENRDIAYSLALPVAKRNIVRARIMFAVVTELAQLLVMLALIPLALKLNPVGNQAGLDANLALVGLGLAVYGVFNLVFFTLYYKDVHKVGVPFVVSGVVMLLLTAVDIMSTYVVPFVRDVLDTPDWSHLGAKLAALAAGAALFALLTGISCKVSEKRFVEQDLE